MFAPRFEKDTEGNVFGLRRHNPKLLATKMMNFESTEVYNIRIEYTVMAIEMKTKSYVALGPKLHANIFHVSKEREVIAVPRASE